MTGVCVLGLGARTPVGLRAPTSAAAVRGTISRLREHPFVVDRSGEPMTVAMDARLELGVPVTQRVRALGRSACTEALRSVGAPNVSAAVHVCTALARPGLGDLELQDAARGVVAAASELCRVERMALHARGHASAALAVGQAVDQLVREEVEIAVIVGTDSYLDASALEWLDAERRIQHLENPTGFYPGEAAGAFVLGRAGLGRALGVPERARVLGVGAGHEPAHGDSKQICTGVGLAATLEQACASLRLPEQRVGQLWCDLNGERARSEELMYVPQRIWRPVLDFTAYRAPADAWGDVGAASLPLYVVLSACSMMRGWASSTYAMAWAGSDDGTRGALTLELQEHPS